MEVSVHLVGIGIEAGEVANQKVGSEVREVRMVRVVDCRTEGGKVDLQSIGRISTDAVHPNAVRTKYARITHAPSQKTFALL